jgi:hypothetical protein
MCCEVTSRQFAGATSLRDDFFVDLSCVIALLPVADSRALGADVFAFAENVGASTRDARPPRDRSTSHTVLQNDNRRNWRGAVPDGLFAAAPGLTRRGPTLYRRGYAPVRWLIPPCLPTKAPQPPTGDTWVHEIKHDGFRTIARKHGDRVRLYSRPEQPD